MKIIRVLIQKKQGNENMYIRNNMRDPAYEEHISKYLHSLVYLGLDDPLLEKKMKIWKRFISNSGDARLKYYEKLMAFQKEENIIVIKALDKIEEEKGKGVITGIGTKWKPGTWGMLTYEFESEE